MKISIKTESRYPVDKKHIRKTIKEYLKSKQEFEETEVAIDVYFVGDRKMKTLNQKYLDRDKTTDVLSFSLTEEDKEIDEEFITAPEDILHLGEVIVSYPQARKQAGENNVLVDEEIDRLVIHGLKHLLGIHHD